MNSYGFAVDGHAAPNEVAMLETVIRTPIGSSGSYTFPTLSAEMVGKYRHEVSVIESILDTTFEQSFGDLNGQAAAPRVIATVADNRVHWATSTISSGLYVATTITAILIWRYKI